MSEIVYISTNELNSYRGEYVILPVSMPLINYIEGGLAKMFSNHIIPVFLGLTMVKDTLENEEVNYLRQYAPIGCRDERTLLTLRKYGIQSFLNGCFTITMPDRCHSKENNLKEADRKPYIVDVDPSILTLLPETIKNEAIYKTHHLKTSGINRKKLTKELYEEYKTRASLVVTSLLHCALPCYAAGIPTILINKQKEISYRFSWIEKILPVYSEDDLRTGSIDWKPVPADIQSIKKESSIWILRC